MDDKHSNTENFLDSKILYPEVLEESDLLLMLKERHVPVEMRELGDKVSLLNLCHKNIVPRPQRNYRSNRRGEMMRQQQIELYGESSSNLTVLSKNNFTECRGDRLKPPPADGKLKLVTDSDKVRLPQYMDRLKLSPSSSPGDRLKPPPCSDRLKPVISSGPTENKVIRLSSRNTLAPCSFPDGPNNKRSAAAAAAAAAGEDDKSRPSKRIHLASSAAALNQGVGTNKSHEKSKDLSNGKKSEDGSAKKFKKISWP